MRNNLDSDPRVIEIAAELNLDELQVVGCLWKVWAWADQHTLDGNAIRVTSVTLDRFTRVSGFADALRKVGWLEGRDSALTFPRFAEHNGQTAKKRAETKERVEKHRNAKRVTSVTQKALPEKRREEKRRTKEKSKPKNKARPDSVEEVRAYCIERNNTVNPELFWDHYEANGWRQGKGIGRPVKDWKACVRTWEQNEVDRTGTKTELDWS